MNRERQIDSFYKILGLYEDMTDPKNTIDSRYYKTYLKRLYIMYQGLGEDEIYGLIKGLYQLGKEADHDTVKMVTFHLIDKTKRGEETSGISNV